MYSVSTLKAYHNFVTTNPAGRVAIHGDWTRDSMTALEWRKWFRDCLHKKINRDTPRNGRKLSADYQRDMWQAQWRINTPRLIIDWLPPELKTRFRHRLRERDC